MESEMPADLLGPQSGRALTATLPELRFNKKLDEDELHEILELFQPVEKKGRLS